MKFLTVNCAIRLMIVLIATLLSSCVTLTPQIEDTSESISKSPETKIEKIQKVKDTDSIAQQSVLISNNIHDIAINENAVWVATDRGVSMMDRTKDTWKHYTKDYGLGSDNINVAAIDGKWIWFGTDDGVSRDDKYAWFGTFDAGVIRYDKETKSWDSFSRKNGLAHNRVLSMTVDGDQVWIGTQRGLSRYEKLKIHGRHSQNMATQRIYKSRLLRFLQGGVGTGSMKFAGKDFRIIVEEANQWNDLFKRYEGWTGADGIYAIPLSGYESPGKANETKTLFVFSDSFIGQVDQNTMVRKNFCMVNNTLALLDGGDPIDSKIRFIWGNNGDGSESSVFVPTTPKTQDKKCWYWLQDGIFLHGNIYIFPMIIEENPVGSEGFKFKLTGLSMIKIPVNSGNLELAKHTQADTPFYHINKERTLFFGAGIMSNTVESGAAKPDGYIYIYGRYESGEVKLAVARVKAEDFEDFSKWRFWDGKVWSDNIEDTAQLGRGGPELSVSPIESDVLKGKYLMVSMHVEQDLYIRIGESPVGPFGPRINIYRTSEPDAGNGIYTYNAKAHPSLSKPGEWLISYNVNSTSWHHLVNNADIYRPRFLKVRFEKCKSKTP